MNVEEKIGVIRKAVDCCFVRSGCYPCPFYQEACHGKPGRCLGMKNAGKLIIQYLDDIEQELKNGKNEQKKS